MGGTVGARTRQLAVGVQVEGDAATSRRGHEPEWKRGILEVRRFWRSGGPQMDKMNQFDQWNHSSDRSFFQYTYMYSVTWRPVERGRTAGTVDLY